MRPRLVLGLAMAGIVGVAAVASLAGRTSSSPRHQRSVSTREPIGEAQLVALAKNAARGNGEPNPQNIEWVRTTRHLAVKASSDAEGYTDGDRDVFLLQLGGNFVATHFSHPRGSPGSITGSAITLVVDSYTGEVTDSGISDKVIDLAALGPVQRPSTP